MSQNVSNTTSETAAQNTLFPFLNAPPELASTHASPLPFVFKIDVSDWAMTEEQFEQFSQANPELKIEMSGKGELIIMPSTGFIPGVKNTVLIARIFNWAEKDSSGIVADSSTMYVLPNGAKRSPDVSWVLREKLTQFSQTELQKYAPFAPNFVIELRSPSDSLKELQEKMTEYAENGVRLGWLIDPSKKQVHIYKPNAEPRVLENPQTLSGEDVLNNFTLDLSEIWDLNVA